MSNIWIVKNDGEIIYKPQTIDVKVLDISDEALAKISMYVNGESITTSNLKLKIKDLRHKLDKAEEVINYYASLENWEFEEIDQSDVEFYGDSQSEVGGKRARDFLLEGEK